MADSTGPDNQATGSQQNAGGNVATSGGHQGMTVAPPQGSDADPIVPGSTRYHDSSFEAAADRSYLTNEQRGPVLVAAAGGLFTSWVMPLIVYMVYREQDETVRMNVGNILRTHVALCVAIAATYILGLVSGFPPLIILSLVLPVAAPAYAIYTILRARGSQHIPAIFGAFK